MILVIWLDREDILIMELFNQCDLYVFVEDLSCNVFVMEMVIIEGFVMEEKD